VETESKCIYFAGDTALFGDMKLYGELWDIDVAVLPIGDRFTMGPKHAARAVEMLRPSHVVPCHFNTFSFIQIDPEIFVAEVGSSAQVHVLAPGETFRLD
jgi:L-ascorbate metabolism protein UlaG (beta-lactamase superfamily)